MVGPIDAVADQLPLDIHGTEERDIGQVGSAPGGVVGHDGIARSQTMLGQDPPGAEAHPTEMHGDVLGIGDEIALSIEEGTGEIQAVLDVHRAGGTPEHGPHRFGHLLHAIGVEFQGGLLAAPTVPVLFRSGPRLVEDRGARAIHRHLPVLLDDGRTVGIDQECQTPNLRPRC